APLLCGRCPCRRSVRNLDSLHGRRNSPIAPKVPPAIAGTLPLNTRSSRCPIPRFQIDLSTYSPSKEPAIGPVPCRYGGSQCRTHVRHWPRKIFKQSDLNSLQGPFQLSYPVCIRAAETTGKCRDCVQTAANYYLAGVASERIQVASAAASSSVTCGCAGMGTAPQRPRPPLRILFARYSIMGCPPAT